MTCCQGPQCLRLPTTMNESGKLSGGDHERLFRKSGRQVTHGILPILRVLASRGCNGRDSVCLVPFDSEMDAATHLQTILLEAYCRESGIRVLKTSRETIKGNLCPDRWNDLSCVLVTYDDPYFPVAPE